MHPYIYCSIIFKKILFAYLTERERTHKQEEGKAEGEGEAGSLLRRESNAGLDSRTLRS